MKKKNTNTTDTHMPAPTLADVLNALGPAALSDVRRRDLRSAVKRVAVLLGDDAGRIVLDLCEISACLQRLIRSAPDCRSSG